MAINVSVNPVLRRELVERMRGRRTFVVLTIYLGVLAGILYLVYQANRGTTGSSFGAPVATQIASVGRGIFEWLLFFMLLLVLFLVPGQTSGAIAGERERQTLVPLQITLLRPVSLLIGKIGASLAFLLLLLVVTVPLLSVSYLIGGVTIAQVLGGVAMVAFTGVIVACLTACISAFCRRVQAATVLSYGMVIALTLGTILVYAAAGLLDTSRGTDEANPPEWILYPNPFVMVADVVGGDNDSFGTTSSPFDPIHDWLARDETLVDGGGDDVGFAVNGGGEVVEFDEFGNPIFESSTFSSFWPISAAVLATLAALAVAFGARRLRTPAPADR
jgi:ABC-2 type transport system permease protein